VSLYSPLRLQPPTSTLFPYTTLFRSRRQSSAPGMRNRVPGGKRSPKSPASKSSSSSSLRKVCRRISVPWSTLYSRLTSVCLASRSEEHTSELQSRVDLVCRLLLEKKK